MKITDMITVEVQRNIFGKSSGIFKAAICGFECTGPTRETALKNLSAELRETERYNQYRRYFFTDSGETLCLYRNFGGWQYDIIRKGDQHPGTTMLGNSYNEETAVKAVLAHVAQYNANLAV